MSDIYLPIDYSDVKNVIPPGEDIIYSTLCRGEVVDMTSTHMKKTSWPTHLLMTNKGIAFSIPIKINYTRKQIKSMQNPPVNHYVLWENVYAIGIGQIKKNILNVMVSSSEDKIKNNVDLYFQRHPDFESKEKFGERLKIFAEKFVPFHNKIRDQFMEELYDVWRANPELTKRSKFYAIEDNKRFDHVAFQWGKMDAKRVIKEAKKAEKK